MFNIFKKSKKEIQTESKTTPVVNKVVSLECVVNSICNDLKNEPSEFIVDGDHIRHRTKNYRFISIKDFAYVDSVCVSDMKLSNQLNSAQLDFWKRINNKLEQKKLNDLAEKFPNCVIK